MTLRDRRSFLWDMLHAARAALSFTSGRTFTEYQADLMLRSAVERQLEIVGEAMRQMLSRYGDPDEALRGAREIIAFRNRLAHGYSDVNNAVVWGVIEEDLPELVEQLERALGGEPPEAP